MRLLLNLRDSNFTGDASSCAGKRSRVVIWDRSCQSDAPLIRTDRHLFEMPSQLPEYGWLLEPTAIVPEIRAQLARIEDRYERIFTSSTDLVDASAKYAFAPASGIWIRQPALYPKSRCLSMFASLKTRTTGHRLRLAWADRLRGQADIYGLDRRVRFKEAGLADYMFSVVFENSREPGYFTEKLLDCFATGTVPIYWGCPNIDRFFDQRGIITFSTDFDPRQLSRKLYDQLAPYVQGNFLRCLPYEIPEDFIARTYFLPRLTRNLPLWCRFRGSSCTTV